jgi:hypothetical protein
MKKQYSHMLQYVITGIVISRHTSEKNAARAWRKVDSARAPVRVVSYSEYVYNEMKRRSPQGG